MEVIMNKLNHINVLFSSDNNYAQHLCAAIYSLLAHNQKFDNVNIYIVDNEIHEENKERIQKCIDIYKNAKIQWIDFSFWKEQLNLNMQWDISISSYARLFIDKMLPNDIEKILYLDCDIIVCDCLSSLWNMKLDKTILAAVQDTIGDNTKAAVGLQPMDRYFNAGVLLINLIEWRDNQIGERCLKFINDRHGTVTHHDQGVLNGVLRNNWYRLPLRNNIMTIHYIVNKQKIDNCFNDHSDYYSEEEIIAAKEHPAILHFTPSFTSRPWVKNCKHPLKNKYWEALKHTSWDGATPEKDKSKWYVRLVDWRYRHFN